MPGYVLGHHLKGEGKRLALMSELLDPVHRRYLESLDVVKPGAKTLEVGCGNGSISAWLARQVAPGGRAIAVDAAGSIYVGGMSPATWGTPVTVAGFGSFIAKLDPDGNLTWNAFLGSSGVRGLALDGIGNVFACKANSSKDGKHANDRC